MKNFLIVLALLVAFVLGSGCTSRPSGTVEGQWEVSNAAGQKTGQTVTITSDRITMETPGIKSSSDGPAKFSKEGEKLTADWLGAKATFVIADPNKVEMTWGAAKWTLTRK